MACYHPLHLFRKDSGGLVGTPPAGQVPRPITINCGQCIGCRLERSRQWAVRCVHEAKMHDANSFITLTYDDDHLPKDGSLDLTHWQRFAKKLRNRIGPFRFFHCGEYGDQTARPHYHALIFGENFSFDRKLYQHTPRGDVLYTSDALTETWAKGYAIIGALTVESAAYVARYCTKKITGELAADHYKGRKPEYATMSRRPGIGRPWLDKYMTDVYPNDFVVGQDGKQSRPPKFYDYVLEQSDPDQLLDIKEKRVLAGQKPKVKLNNTPKRLAVRETVKRAQLSQLKRSI